MRGRRPALALAALVVALTWQLSSTPAWADFKSEYGRGLEAVKAQRWSDAAELMSAAIAGNPKEGRVRLYGMHFEPYIPHYYLGLARFQMGDCPGALRAWAISESQGFISGLPEYADLTAKRTTCQQRLASAEPTPKSPTAVPEQPRIARALEDSRTGLRTAEAAAAKLGDLRKKRDYQSLWSADPALSKRGADAAGILEQARAKLRAGESASDETELAAAAALAQQAKAAYNGLSQELEQRHRRAVLGARRSPTPERLAAAATATSKPTRPLLPTTTPPPAATREVSREPTVIPVRSTKPPERLRTAAAAFFDAEYETTLTTLKGASFSDPRAVATAHLLRAVANYSLYLQGGEKNQDLRDNALAEARLCLRVRPQTRLDPLLFSPRLAALFAEAR